MKNAFFITAIIQLLLSSLIFAFPVLDSTTSSLVANDKESDKSFLKERKKQENKKNKIINNTFLRPGQDSDEDIILEPDKKD